VHRTARVRMTGLVLLPVIVLAPAAAAVQVWWPESPRASFYPDTSTHAFLSERLGNDRFLSTGDAMLPGSNLAYGLRSLDGHAFTRTSFSDLLRAIDPDGFVAPTLWHPGLDAAAGSGELLDRLAVRYLVAPPDAAVLGSPQISGTGGSVVSWQSSRTLRLALDGSALRGVGVVLATGSQVTASPPPASTPPAAPLAGSPATASPAPASAVIEARLFDASGDLLATGSRRLTGPDEVGPVAVPLAGEDPAAPPVRAELTLISQHPLDLAGAVSQPQLVVVSPGDDDLRLVRTGETTIYERLTALPRIRWAATAEIPPAGASTVDLLRSGRAADVVLDSADPAGSAVPGGDLSDSAGPTGSSRSGATAQQSTRTGSAATVEVLEDSGDTIRVRASADGAGHLVVADALKDSFVATLDGVEVPLLTADHGYVAVAVSAGEHEVELTYRSPGGSLGLLASGLTLAALATLIIANPGGHRARLPNRDTGAAGD